MNVKRVKKWGCVALALFMGVTIDNGFTAGMLTKNAVVKAEEITTSLQDDSKNTLTYDNKIQSDQDTRYVVKVSRTQDFPSGYSSYIEEMSKDDTQECIDFLNKKLKDSNQEVCDFVDPMEISVSNDLNETATDLGKVNVRVYMENTDGLSDYTLYHFKDDDCETVDFTTGVDNTRSSLTNYIEFSTDSFSPFIFVKTQEKTKEADKKDSESKKKEEDEKIIEEDSELQSDENGINAISEDTSTDTGTPSIYFRTFKTTLFKGATKNDDGSYTWTPSSPDKGHRFAYRISYSISGVDQANPGQIKMTIPKSLIVDRDGKTGDSYEMSIPEKKDVDAYLAGDTQDIDTDINFAYYEEGDNIVIYNFRAVPAGDNGYIDMAYYTTETTFNYVDRKEYNFTANGTITCDNGAVSEMTADTIKSNIDTKAEITSTEKEYPSKFNSWNSSWGNAIKPENASDYVYLVWEIESKIDATQKYDFEIDDVIKGGTDEMTNAMKVIGFRFEGGSWQKSNKVTNQTLYTQNNNVVRNDFVLTAIDKSKLNELEYWKAVNNITSIVTPVDGDEATSAKSTRTWTWQKPTFVVPSGHFYSYKRADGAYRANDPHGIFYNVTHYAKDMSIKAGDYSRYDLESFNGYDNTKKSLTEYDNLDYASWIVGYGYPWTYDYDKYRTDGKDPDGYGKINVDYELRDTGIYLFDATEPQATAPKTDVLTSDDFCYYQLDYSYYFKDAVWNEEEQKFDSTSSNITFQDGETISFYGKFGKSDKSVLFATHNLKTGEVWFDSTYVDSISNGHIYFKDGADMVEYTLKTSNTHYYTELYTVPFAKLKNSKTVMDFVEGKTDIGITNINKGYVYSANYDHSTYSIESEDKGTKNLIFSHTDSDTDYVRTTKRDSALTKTVLSSSNNTKKKAYAITWCVEEEETATTGEGDIIPIPQETGTVFDLLPKGSTVDKDTIRVYNGERYLNSTEYTIKTINNYKNSGRTLLIVKVTTGGDYYKLTYDTLYSWDSIKDYGETIRNSVAYKTGNDAITNGFADNGGSEYPSGEKNPDAIEDSSLMTGLDDVSLDDKKTGDDQKYIYAEKDIDVTALTAASSGLKKKVKEERDKDWSYSTMTKINGNYAYRLRYQNSNSSSAKDMIFFDSLENYDRDTMRDYGNDSDWRGTLQSVDTTQLEEKGIKPVIYISTIEKLDIEEHNDLKDSSVWTKVTKNTDLSTAKAVAIDMRKTTDGKDYTLAQNDSVVAYLYMKAPSYAPEAKDGASLPYAYNNIYISNTIQDEDEKSSQNFLIHQDYTKISLMVSGSFGLRKVSSESSDITISDTTFKLYGTSSYGTEYNQTLTTNKNGEINFEDIEMGQYTLKEQSTTDDWLLDTTEHQVVIDNVGKAYVDGVEYSNKYVFIENNPRIHTNINFKKADITNIDKKLADSQFRLSGVSDYGTNIFMYAKSNSSGTVSFNNIEKGTYELTEVKATNGYVLNQNVYEVKIDNNGLFSISFKNQIGPTLIDVINSNGTYIIGNEPLHNVLFYKASNWDNETLELAKFSLKGTSDFGTQVDMETYSDKNGRVEFSDLESGVYTLQEVSAPTGYSINNNKYTVEVKTIQDGQSGDEVTIKGLSTNDAILDGKVLVFYDSPKEGKLIIEKDWDDGEEDRNPSELNVTVSTEKPSKYYANRTITFDANGGIFDGNLTTNQISYGTLKTGEIVSVVNGKVLKPSINYGKFLYWTANKDGTGDKYYSLSDDDYNIADEDGNIIVLKENTKLYAQYYMSPYAYMMKTNIIPKDTDTAIVFTDEDIPYNASDISDVSKGGDYSVMSWRVGTTLYISSRKSGQKVYAPENCNIWFQVPDSLNDMPIQSIDLSNLDTSKVTNMRSMFDRFPLLTSLDLSNFDTSKVEDMSFMFAHCKSLTNLDLSHFDTRNVTKMGNMFKGCYKITTLDLSSFDTSKVEDMGGMFEDCCCLTSLDIRNFDTSKVEDMGSMFEDCDSLTSLDVSNFITSSVKDMSFMFCGCNMLSSLNVDNFNTSKVKNMFNMFASCSSLTSLDLSSFDTSKVENMSAMFYRCSGLTDLELSSFDTSNVTTMNEMFRETSALTSLDLSSFDTIEVSDMYGMFYSCISLKNIIISNKWYTEKVNLHAGMFSNATNLPNYDEGYVNKTKAYAGEGGYLTMNPNCIKPYSVHFEKNLSSATGTMNNESFAEGEAKTLTTNNFTDLSGEYVFKEWNTKADGTGKSYSNEQSVQYLTADSTITLYAQWKNVNEKYSHTSNIDDDGKAKSVHNRYEKITDTVSIDGAKKLKVEIWFSTQTVYGAYVSLKNTSGRMITSDSNGNTIGVSGMLGGGCLSAKPRNDSDYHKIFYIDGDTVQFYFTSGVQGYYGYYAIVTKAE